MQDREQKKVTMKEIQQLGIVGGELANKLIQNVCATGMNEGYFVIVHADHRFMVTVEEIVDGSEQAQLVDLLWAKEGCDDNGR